MGIEIEIREIFPDAEYVSELDTDEVYIFRPSDNGLWKIFMIQPGEYLTTCSVGFVHKFIRDRRLRPTEIRHQSVTVEDIKDGAVFVSPSGDVFHVVVLPIDPDCDDDEIFQLVSFSSDCVGAECNRFDMARLMKKRNFRRAKSAKLVVEM